MEVFLQAHRDPPQEIVLDLDSTDIPLHGEQEERFFHGYYGHYCYLPLYIVCGEYVLCARLRPSNIDGAKGSVAEVERSWARSGKPGRRCGSFCGVIGFCRTVAGWCEAHGVDYVVGLAQNPRLLRAIAAASEQAASQYQEAGSGAGIYGVCLSDRRQLVTRRRVIAKADTWRRGESTLRGHLAEPAERYFRPSRWGAQSLLRSFSARGDMETGSRTDDVVCRSPAVLDAEQPDPALFSTVAYLLMQGLRRLGLVGTELARRSATRCA